MVPRFFRAERVRFELTVPYGTHAFQASALSHSAISPNHLLLADDSSSIVRKDEGGQY